MRSEARIREMQQSGPCALWFAFLERSLVSMLPARRSCIAEHAIIPICSADKAFV